MRENIKQRNRMIEMDIIPSKSSPFSSNIDRKTVGPSPMVWVSRYNNGIIRNVYQRLKRVRVIINSDDRLIVLISIDQTTCEPVL